MDEYTSYECEKLFDLLFNAVPKDKQIEMIECMAKTIKDVLKGDVDNE